LEKKQNDQENINYIFSAICTGLAANIGHLDIAAIMALYFCFTNALLWHIVFGSNPIDDARLAKETRRAATLIVTK
jgi:hypothetical protein